MNILLKALRLAGTLSILTACLYGQTGTIQGTVVDASGASVPNAKVLATDEGKGVVAREAKTDAAGRFQLLELLRGTYSLRVEAAGFKGSNRAGLVLDPNQTLDLGQVALEVGQTTESVEVTAESPLVETGSADRGFVLPGYQVTEQSLNGRDFQSLIRTLPGVVSNDASDFRLAFNNTDSFQVNGLRGSMNNVYLDGSINTDVGANDGQYTQVSLDAVGEFKLQTSNFAAEYGRNPGVLISISTKSGSSKFHGTLYEFLRNDALDANRYFANLQGAKKPKLRFNQFGANLGGWVPIPKVSSASNKRVFFFFNYEGTRASRPDGAAFVDVPNPALLQGDFRSLLRSDLIRGTNFPVGTVFQPGTLVRDSAGNITGGVPYPNNQVPQSLWAKNTPAFLKVINQLNFASGTPIPGQPDVFRVPYQDTYTFQQERQGAPRRLQRQREDQLLLPLGGRRSERADGTRHLRHQHLPGVSGIPQEAGRQLVVEPDQHTFADDDERGDLYLQPPDADRRRGAGHRYRHLRPRQAAALRSRSCIPTANVDNKFPKFSAGSLNFNNFAAGWLSEGKTYAFTDNVTKIVGSHTLKAGIFWNRNDNVQQPGWTDATNINFNPSLDNPNDTGNGLANMLLGNYTSAAQQNGQFLATFRFKTWEAYAQDSWKVNRKLTLGIRTALGLQRPDLHVRQISDELLRPVAL